MKQLEIQGQKVFALTVTEGMLESMTQNGAKWFSNGSINCFGLPMGIYTVIADSGEPEKFVKVWYPDAKSENFLYAGWVILVNGDAIIADCATDSFAWLLASCKIMQEHGLEGRIVLLTETA